MRTRYHAIEEGLWNHRRFDAAGNLPDAPFEERAFFVFLSANFKTRASGIYRATDGQLAEESHSALARVRVHLASLTSRGLIVRDGAWVFLPGKLERSKMNDRLIVGVNSDLESCKSIPIIEAFSQHYPLFDYSTPIEHLLSNCLAPVSIPISLPITITKTKTSISTTTTDSGWPSPKMLVQLYNELAPAHLPRVTTLNPQREKKTMLLLKVYSEQGWWEEVFMEYPQSKFLMGAVKGNGHGNFQPHFDWLLGKDKQGQDNCVKVHDGNYRDPVAVKATGRVYPPLPDGPPPCSPEVAQANLKKISGLFDKMMAEKEAKVGQDVSKYPLL